MDVASEIVESINRDLPKPLTLLVEKYYRMVAFLSKKRLLDGKVPLEDLTMTVSIKAIESYKNKNAPHVIMAVWLKSSGNNLELGSRLEKMYLPSSTIMASTSRTMS
ncbi:hypothetical protein BGZ83_006187 [Gryganskiella cystojenkinii]|nr:hypothetical protein BGZ83_006187 [Gryganskiella cystojenkinii]